MGFIGVEGMGKLLKARDNTPQKKLERWRKAVTALPLLTGLKELEKLGMTRGLVYSYVEHVSVIYTPLSKRPDSGHFPLTGSNSLHALAMMHSNGCLRDITVEGLEADALDSIAPSLKTETSLDTLPGQLKSIQQDDQFGLLMQSRAHALRWHKEMLIGLRKYLSGPHPSSDEVPDPLHELRLSGAKNAKDIDAVVMKRLQKACDAYALAYTLYCGAQLISDEMSDGIVYLGKLGVSRVDRFDALLERFRSAGVFAHTNKQAYARLPQVTSEFVKNMAGLTGRSLEGEIRRVLT